tara:strand:+ start:3136 stop:4890 length:1755 start_codon:yes stop_codon:yes gene_type:complete
MAETLISPGVLARENDQSQLTSQPVQAGAAIIGPTVKGPEEIPTMVTSYTEYLANYGSTFTSGSDEFTYFTSISAFNYFQNGGSTLIVTRVTSGSFTSATSSYISGSTATTEKNRLVLETIGEGELMNSLAVAQSGNTIVDGSNNTLPSGSVDNLRWEIASPNTSSGTFSVIVRRGNDTKKSKTVLETFTNVSLDPKATNFVSKVIGDQKQVLRGSGTTDVYLQTSGSYPNASRYIRVKSVSKTPDYLDNAGNAKNEFTSSIPVAASGGFGNGSGKLVYNGSQKALYYQDISNTNTQGINATDYTDAINLLANRDDYRYNLLSTPGLAYEYPTHATQLNTMISNTENRGDNIIVMDLVGYNSTLINVTQQAASLDTSYVASYWPWLQISDPDSRRLVWVPSSAMIPGVYAQNDKAGEAWFAPAGINRGGLGSVRQAERKLTQANRDTLYTEKVNPIATFPGTGVVVFGQKTLQTKASALDRVNVRRLLITLKNFISQIADTLVFEQNTAATRNQFLSQVNPYLESVQQRQGLFAFKVVMDDSNNTPDVIDRNELIGAIYLQPTKTAEFIYLDFNILPTGATFPV